MLHPDEGYEKLSKIYEDFSEFCSKRGQVTEADTRSQIIDRILKEVLGWPESVIGREDSVHQGFIDYVLSLPNGRNTIVVEAKKEGISFDMPVARNTIRYKLNGSIKSNEALYSAINQAHYYAVEKGIRYAVVTNGYAWIFFKAMRDDMPWREGQAIAFNSAGIVKNKFSEFWNILSWESIIAGKYEFAFSNIQPVNRNLFRVIDKLYNPDQPLARNRLHIQLHSIVNRIFGDITESDQVEILERCYIHNDRLRIVDRTLEFVIQDSVPNFAALEGTVETIPGANDGGIFGTQVDNFSTDPNGSVFLLLGGVGAGKSTFLRRFFQFVGKEFIDERGYWFYISFLKPPNREEMEIHVYRNILEQIGSRYKDDNLESREQILEAFKDEVIRLNKTILDAEQLEPIEYQRRLSRYIEEWTSDEIKYTKALVRLLRRRGKAVVICIDNVDQLSPEYQNSIFLLSQRIAEELKSMTVLALREETFYSATIQRTFTAYTNQKFHVSSPSFKALIGHRIRYAREILGFEDLKVKLILKSGLNLDKEQISNFLRIMELSLLSHNKNIARFIECISSGNMRVALNLFTRFLYSGSTDVDKMLNIFSRSGSYFVPFHEFAKSVILGDRRYYRESEELNEIMNVFDCGLERNSSHLTSIRLLSMLLDYHNVSSPEGRGYVKISSILEAFMVVLDNEDDFFRTADRLLRKNLIEVDTRVTDTIQKAGYIRITASGWYYLTFLTNSFSYLDLVYIDTPLNDENIFNELINLTRAVDVLSDDERNRKQKLELRFERVRLFLNYLFTEENREREQNRLNGLENALGRPIIPQIIEKCEAEIASIKRRLGSLFTNDDEEIAPDIPENLKILSDETESQD